MASPPMMPAGWDTGPARRPEHRYWDAMHRTSHVSDAAIRAAGRGAARCVAELLVMSERLARRGVARGHGLAYDLKE
jgi:hypothetical protein